MRDAYQELASAIAVQWIREYLKNARMMVNISVTYLIGENVRKKKALRELYEDSRRKYLECREVLLSAWFEELSDADGRAVVEKIDAKVKEYGNQRILRETKKTVSKD